MSITVKLNYLRISPRKVRLVADLIRGKTVSQANDILEFTRKKTVQPFKKLLRSGIATAQNDFQKDSANLYISKITVDEGPTLKRYRFRAQGRVYSIMKRVSHISLSLDEIKPTKTTKAIKETKVKKALKALKETKEVKEEKKARKIKFEKPRRRIKMPKPKIKETAKKMFRRKAF